MTAVRDRWLVVPVDETHEVHVVPISDLVDHEPENCLCGPRAEPVKRPDGSYGWLIVHHALDGRTDAETEGNT